MPNLASLIRKELIWLNKGSRSAHCFIKYFDTVFKFKRDFTVFILRIWEHHNSKWNGLQAEFIFVQSIIQHVLIWNGVTFSVISHKKFDMDIFDIVRKRLSVITQSVLSFYAILYKNKNASVPSNFAYLYLSIFRMCNTFFRFLFLLFYIFTYFSSKQSYYLYCNEIYQRSLVVTLPIVRLLSGLYHK